MSENKYLHQYHGRTYLIVTQTINEVLMDFTVHRSVGEDLDGKPMYKFDLRDADDSTDLDEPFLSGTVKWDGCIDLEIKETHFCGRNDALSLGSVINKIYDIGLLEIKPQDLDLYNDVYRST